MSEHGYSTVDKGGLEARPCNQPSVGVPLEHDDRADTRKAFSRRDFVGLAATAGLTGAAALTGAGLYGCDTTNYSSKAAANAAALDAGDPDYFEFTDSAGRKVALPRDIKGISPSGSLAQIVLVTLCPEKLISLAGSFSKTQASYIGPDLAGLPVLGRFYGKNADMNYEEIIRMDPDVIVDIGEPKTGIGSDMTGLQEQTGLPCIFVEATVPNIAKAYGMLGEALGVAEAAAELADYAQGVLDFANLHQPEIAADGLKVLYSGGIYGLDVVEKGTVHSGSIDILGLDNVAVLGATNSTEVSIEQVLLWQPDVLLLSPGDAFFDEVYKDASWAEVPAVANRRVYEVPGKPYEWLNKPPSVQQLLGILWLGNLLYPEIYDFDIVERTQEFYHLFWHYDLSADAARELMANSTFLPKEG